jgi:hypothetical protein
LLKSKIRKDKPKLEFDEKVNPNIKVIYEDFTPTQLVDLYYKSHCLINPHKGEGFGLIPREFAATGGISLTTNWSGTADNLDLWGWPLEYSLEIADWKGNKNLQGQDLGVWAKPDMEDLKNKMRSVFEYRENYLKTTKDKSNFVTSFYRWDNFATCILVLWKAILNGRSRRSQNFEEKSGILTG